MIVILYQIFSAINLFLTGYKMLSFISWCIYGLIVGSIAKAIMLKNVTVSFWTTIFLGVVGSYVGGIINYFLLGSDEVDPAGIMLGIVGAVVSIVVYQKFQKNKTGE